MPAWFRFIIESRIVVYAMVEGERKSPNHTVNGGLPKWYHENRQNVAVRQTNSTRPRYGDRHKINPVDYPYLTDRANKVCPLDERTQLFGLHVLSPLQSERNIFAILYKAVMSA